MCHYLPETEALQCVALSEAHSTRASCSGAAVRCLKAATKDIRDRGSSFCSD